MVLFKVRFNLPPSATWRQEENVRKANLQELYNLGDIIKRCHTLRTTADVYEQSGKYKLRCFPNGALRPVRK